jgi:hypothetical protein
MAFQKERRVLQVNLVVPFVFEIQFEILTSTSDLF